MATSQVLLNGSPKDSFVKTSTSKSNALRGPVYQQIHVAAVCQKDRKLGVHRFRHGWKHSVHKRVCRLSANECGKITTEEVTSAAVKRLAIFHCRQFLLIHLHCIALVCTSKTPTMDFLLSANLPRIPSLCTASTLLESRVCRQSSALIFWLPLWYA